MEQVSNSESEKLLEQYQLLKSTFDITIRQLEKRKNEIENKIHDKQVERSTIVKNIADKESQISENKQTILKPIKLFGSFIEKTKIKNKIRDLNALEKVIDTNIKNYEMELIETKKEIQNILTNIGKKQNDISFILSQKEKGLELFDNKWVKIEEIPKLKEIKIGLTNNFANMHPFDFEHFIARLFQEMGYNTEVTQKTGDYGIDIIVKKNNKTIAVQCKRHNENNLIGNKLIQQLLGSMAYVHANQCIFVTTSYFTKNAIEQGKNSPIELWDKDTLHDLVKKYLLNLDIDQIFDAIKREKQKQREILEAQKQELEERKRKELERKQAKDKKLEEKKAIEDKKKICPRCGGRKMKTRKYCSKCKREIHYERKYDSFW